jgi:hypothetical protein
MERARTALGSAGQRFPTQVGTSLEGGRWRFFRNRAALVPMGVGHAVRASWSGEALMEFLFATAIAALVEWSTGK